MDQTFIPDLDGRPTDFPSSWLQERVDLSPDDWLAERIQRTREDNPDLPDQEISAILQALWAFARVMEEGDEMRTFSSDTDSWGRGEGMAGYVILRYGALVGAVVTKRG